VRLQRWHRQTAIVRLDLKYAAHVAKPVLPPLGERRLTAAAPELQSELQELNVVVSDERERVSGHVSPP
jgi:hypothetical protein